MKAVGYFEPKPIEHPQSLEDLDLPVPLPGPHDLRVAVKAVSVNPVDVKVRASARAEAGQPRVLGFDAAGIVESVGAAVTLFKPGDEVFYAGAIDRPGSNSELQLVDERIVGRKPQSLSFEQAAAMPLTSITAWELLFDRLAYPARDTAREGALLIINGAGGVGSILIQLARRLTGLKVIATASREDTSQWSRTMGAHHVIDHHQPFAPQLAEVGVREVEYVASLTASDRHLNTIAEIIAPQGKLALIDDPKSFDIVPFKRKSVSVHWEFMFARSLFQTPDMIEQHRLLNRVAELIDAGVLRTTLTSQAGPLNAANLRKAHAWVESGRAIGKTVLSGLQAG